MPDSEVVAVLFSYLLILFLSSLGTLQRSTCIFDTV